MSEETHYLAIAAGRDELRGRKYGVVIPFIPEERVELRGFYESAGRGAIDIMYQGQSKIDADNSISGLQKLTDRKIIDQFLDKEGFLENLFA